MSVHMHAHCPGWKPLWNTSLFPSVTPTSLSSCLHQMWVRRLLSHQPSTRPVTSELWRRRPGAGGTGVPSEAPQIQRFTPTTLPVGCVTGPYLSEPSLLLTHLKGAYGTGPVFLRL